jgi:hypothetical protein
VGVVVLLGACSVLAADRERPRRAGKYDLLKGKITAIAPDDNQVTVRDEDGKVWKLAVDDKSRLRLDGKPADLGDFKKGTRVRVRYEKKDGKTRVVLMRTPWIAQTVETEIRSAVRAAKVYAFLKRGEYKEKIQSVLGEVDERIQDLRDRIEEGGKAGKKLSAKEMKELRQKREALRKRLDKVKTATADNWEDVKKDISDALDELQKAYEKARKRAKK